MQQRAINLALVGITGAVVAGGVAAGVAANADTGPGGTKAATGAAQAHGPLSHAGKEETGKAPEKKARKERKALVTGTTTASYFFDDGSGVNGDTGMPAGGVPMRKGLFASPSWPLHTKVKVTYKGRSVTGFIGDRGPGEPSGRGVMLDLDTYTFRKLYDGEKPRTKYDAGVPAGHLKGVKYEVLKWGKGPGKKGKPKPYNP